MIDKTTSQSNFVIAAGIAGAAIALWVGVFAVGQIALHLSVLGDPWGFLATVLVVGGVTFGVLWIALKTVRGRMTRA